MKKLGGKPRHRRTLVVVLTAAAIVIVVAEPFGKGVVLLSLTETHGIDSGDLPALAMLAIAGWLIT